jgi:hypothetical protein
MLPVHCIAVALWHLEPLAGLPVLVTLRADVTEVRPGDPVLLKVEAVNRSNTALRFSPPLHTLRLNLMYECKPPGDPEYYRIDLSAGEPRRAQSPRGFEVGAKHVSYDYLIRRRIFVPTPPGRVIRERYILSTEGDWEIRASVGANDTRYYSAPLRVRVTGGHPKPVADALVACAEPLTYLLRLPTLLPEDADVALFAKHLPALADTPAAVPLRRAILLNDVVKAATPETRKEAVARLKEFRDKCSPIQQEYTDLLLGVAYVKCKEFDAARVLIRDIPESSSLSIYIARAINRETRPKDKD